jgi:hypothetical protein
MAGSKEITGYARIRKSGRLPRVSSGGKSHHAQAIRRDSELHGAGTHQANGALRIAELDGMVIARAQPVFQYEGGDAHGIEPGGDLAAFFVHG